MIFSSADILRILGANEIIRLSAKLSITDGKPPLSGAEGIYIYVERFPVLKEFEAAWDLYIESDEDLDLVLTEIRRVLPKVQVFEGLLTRVTTTEIRSDNTQQAPAGPSPSSTQIDMSAMEERFQELSEGIQDQMLLVNSGRPGKNGKNGKDGTDGRDGRDIDATETELFDLKDVGSSPIKLEKGQVLTWDGSKWTNLYVRTSATIGGGGGGAQKEPDDGLGGIINAFWKFEKNEAEDYRNGQFRVNSNDDQSDWSGTTEIYIDYTTAEGENTRNYFIALVKPGQTCYIQRENEPEAYAVFSVRGVNTPVDGDGVRVLVDFVSQGTEVDKITDGRKCAITFTVVDGGSGEGGGIPEAPVDGQQYARQDAAWTVVQATGGGIEEAPQDGNFYVRQNGQWVNLSAALSDLGNRIVDGGDFLKGSSQGDDEIIGGGDFSTGASQYGT